MDERPEYLRWTEEFQRQLGDGFVRLGEMIREAAPFGREAGAPGRTSGDDVARRLRQLRQLENEGLITHEEFEAKKAEILSQL